MSTIYQSEVRPDRYKPKHRRPSDLPALLLLGAIWLCGGLFGALAVAGVQ